MSFALLNAQQLALLLGAAWAITIALYFLKLRRQRVLVPNVQLWESVLSSRPTAALFARLRLLLSLLLALLVVSLLGLSLGDPRLPQLSRAAHSTVLLIDTGITMQASDVKPSRLAAALRQARKLIDETGGQEQFLIAQMDDAVTPLSPMTSDVRALRAALASARPSRAHTRFSEAVHFALDVLQGRPHPRIVLLSDGAFTLDAETEHMLRRSQVPVEHVLVGNRARNLRLSSLAIRRYPLNKSQSEIMVEVENGSARPETALVTLLGDGQELEVESVTLAAHAKLARFYENIGGDSRRIGARIAFADGKPDDLAADDSASVAVPSRARKHVLVVTRGNRYLEAALLLDQYLAVEQISPERYRNADGYDVVIFDDYVPATAPHTPSFYLGLPVNAPASPLVVRGSVKRPFFETLVRNHPLLRFTALHDVNLARASQVTLQPGDQAVAAGAEAPLIVTGVRAGHPFVALTFDLRESDLPLRIAWPMLLMNTLDYLQPEPPGEEPSTTPTALATADITPHQIQLTKNRPSQQSESELWTLLPRDLWWLLTALALALLIAEWLSYQRRWTV